jgi:hypothetical protein
VHGLRVIASPPVIFLLVLTFDFFSYIIECQLHHDGLSYVTIVNHVPVGTITAMSSVCWETAKGAANEV